MNITLAGGDALTDAGIERRDIFIEDGLIADDPAPNARVVDASGLIVAPGIIDLHGDGFERNFSPRPGVFFDIETALIETDRQLLVNGITTAYLALTISWEPGLRSLENAKAFVAAWQKLRPHFVTDMRLQLRWEIFALDAVDTVEQWLQLDPKPTLAFNDHFSMLIDPERRLSRDISKYASRAGLSASEYNHLTDRTAACAEEVPAALLRLTKAATAAGVPCLAHDEMTAKARSDNRALGITISEFPMSRDAAQAAVAAGEPTILGAPNIVRGGSHIGALDAEPAAIEGLCAALASDYFYPAMLNAAGHLLNRGDMKAADVWGLISGNAARAVGLDDRGSLKPGRRGDVVMFRQVSKTAMIEACIHQGNLTFFGSN